MPKKSEPQPHKPVDWTRLSDAELLAMRVRDLQVSITGSILQVRITQLYQELHERGIRFRPPCYLADEWLCPEKMPIIGIPFWLAHPRLIELEQKMMLEAEGADETHCMKLLRHECGHAINYAYELYKRTRWRELFGPFSAPYNNTYSFLPYSRRYVVHLSDHYAQSHPDEDFAETFAVWLNPHARWRSKYRDWPVLKKLLYIDSLMGKIANTDPTVQPDTPAPWSAARMTSTLQAYYERKRKALGADFYGYYDNCLRRLFSTQRYGPPDMPAAQLLRTHRRLLVRQVAQWTEHRKYNIDQLVGRLIDRCEQLELYGRPNDLVGLTALLTAIAGRTFRPDRRVSR
jgi:hypothetical protein